MASTIVYACDWCDEIVPKRESDGQPQFSAHVSVKAGMSITATEFDICRSCLDAFKAIQKGKYRR